MADNDATASSGNGNAATQEDEPSASSALRQRLLTVDEVYVYKIPPLRNAGGHRAEDWNLANPLQTCQLIVERRGDVLVLEFSVAGALFCQSVIDLSSGASPDAPNLTMEQMVEAAVDTSRYFVTRIQGPAKTDGKTGHHNAASALIGFGFRERDTAVDFRESIQFYQRAMQREKQADQSGHKLAGYSIPKLGEDEKIHVNFGGKKVSTTITKAPTGGSGSAPSPGAGGSSAPLLLKKPPPPSDSVPGTDSEPHHVDGVHAITEQLSSSLDLAPPDEASARNRTPDGGSDDKVNGDDDENDWDEFQSAA